MIEPLENRRLFAIAVPLSVQFAYDALNTDAKRLGEDVASVRKALAVDKKALTADVKALGNTAANKALLRAAESAGAKFANTLAAVTSRFAAAAKPVYRRLEIAAATFADAPSPGTSNTLAAAVAAMNVIQGKQYVQLLDTVAAGPAAYAAALTALASANPTAAQLSADVGSATNAQSTLSAAVNDLVTKVQTDTTTLINVE